MQFTDIKDRLAQPFPMSAIKWKPGAMTKDKTKGLGMPYADARVYQDILNEICPEDWQTKVTIMPTGNKITAICELEICGIVRTSTGEEAIGDQNAATSAEAQAFKRAASAFGLGRYLYLASGSNLWEPVTEWGGFSDASITNLNNRLAALLRAHGVEVGSSTSSQTAPSQPAPPPAAAPSPVQAPPPAAPPKSVPPSAAPPAQAQSPHTGAAPTGKTDLSWATRLMTPDEIALMNHVKEVAGIIENSELNFWARKWCPDVDSRVAGITNAAGGPVLPYHYIRTNVQKFHDFVVTYIESGPPQG